jgi:hypothetical protein
MACLKEGLKVSKEFIADTGDAGCSTLQHMFVCFKHLPAHGASVVLLGVLTVLYFARRQPAV